MRNPTYAEDFQASPMPERIVSIAMHESPETQPVLSIGVKTITHNRSCLKLYPHKVVVIEMREGDDVSSFDLPPIFARAIAARLLEFSDSVEAKAA